MKQIVKVIRAIKNKQTSLHLKRKEPDWIRCSSKTAIERFLDYPKDLKLFL